MKHKLLLAISFFILQFPLLGQTYQVTDSLANKVKNQSYMKLKDYVNCSSTLTSIERRICANLEFQYLHQEMDSILHLILNYYEEKNLTVSAAVLVNSQRNWQNLRNEDCKHEHGAFMNKRIITAAHLIYLADYTAKRLEALQKIKKDEFRE